MNPTMKLHLRFPYLEVCNIKPVKRLQQKLRWLTADKTWKLRTLVLRSRTHNSLLGANKRGNS